MKTLSPSEIIKEFILPLIYTALGALVVAYLLNIFKVVTFNPAGILSAVAGIYLVWLLIEGRKRGKGTQNKG